MSDSTGRAPRTDWPSGRPDFAGDLLAHWVLSSATELTGVRRELVARVGRLPVGAGARAGSLSLADTLALLLSELVTNALRHAVPPAEVSVFEDGGSCLLDVADPDPARPPAPEHDRSPGLGGHGLPLVALLATHRGWYVQDGRKHVWACLRS